MKEEILNVIEYVDGEILHITSYIVQEENKDSQLNKAETFFKGCILDNQLSIYSMSEEELDNYVDDGSYSKNNYQIDLIWSHDTK